MTDTAAKPDQKPVTGAAQAPAKPAPAPAAAPVATPAPVAKEAAKPVPKAPVAAPAVAKQTPKPAPKPVAAKPAPAAVSAPVTKSTPAAPRAAVKPVAKKPAPRAKVAPAQPASTRQASRPATIAAKEVIMSDTIKTVTEKTQAYFAEANERAKGSIEKGVKAFEDANAFHKGNLEAIVESSKIAVKGVEKMGQDAAAYAKTSYEKATETFKAMSTVKSPTELFKLQSDYARASFDAFVAEASRSTEAALKLAGEIAQPISNRVALAAEKIKVAA
ncbi:MULTISPECIES: phasin family protein [Sphingomonas]|uniref:Phasin family protein n=1 Tax=Sphingomonas lycopersici TaxID=2951807 RepID=A0AA42CRE8_9SPHN|nr:MULTISPECIES: phasin family protein [Sphingomonas]MCW6536209.1 phasin family protein [Sphingomonas lycopersici]OJU23602.1 MAG: hypothetical protein BGN95_17830 [Sphingomonas sp. 66-10]